MEERKMIEGTFAVLDRHLMVKMPRELDHHNAGRIRERADYFLLMDNVDSIVFDFEDTVFMDSSGIGVIMGRYKRSLALEAKYMSYIPTNVSKKLLKCPDYKTLLKL